MKVVIIIITGITFSVNTQCYGQTWKEWFKQKKTKKEYLLQQIVALQVYLGYVKKGYEIVNGGLDLIADIKDGNFNLHKDYFASLDAVNPSVSNSTKVVYILALQKLIHKEVQSLYEDCHNNDNYSADEIDYLLKVYDNLLVECDASVEDLKSVITNDVLKMNDDERLERMEMILGELQHMYAFTRNFGNSNRLLALQRYRGYSEVGVMEHLHDVQP